MSKQWTVRNMPRQEGRRAIVTGANSGIGYYTALELARHGAAVVLACRSRAKAEQAALHLGKEVPGASVEVAVLDLASLQSVRSFAEIEMARAEPLDLLINNAGVYCPPERRETKGVADTVDPKDAQDGRTIERARLPSLVVVRPHRARLRLGEHRVHSDRGRYLDERSCRVVRRQRDGAPACRAGPCPWPWRPWRGGA